MEPLEHIWAIAARLAGERGLEVWDVTSRQEMHGRVVRVFLDRPGPASVAAESVSVDECADLSRELSTILDVDDPLPCPYTLEVSSPGLDRPLRQVTDYERFSGRLAKIVVREPVDNQKAFTGRLRGVEDAAVLLEGAGGRVHRLPMHLITRGQLEVEF